MSFKFFQFAFLLLLPIHVASQTFALEDILSAPYCSDLTKSADGKSIASELLTRPPKFNVSRNISRELKLPSIFVYAVTVSLLP